MTIPNCLLDHVEDFQYGPDRAKVSGRMWGGSAKAEVDGHTYVFGLWYHGSNNEDHDSLKPRLNLQSVDGLDAYWHVIWNHESVWLHPVGWFDDKTLGEHPIIKSRGNPNFSATETDTQQMEKLGFVQAINP